MPLHRRRDAHEQQFVHEEVLRFKASVRRNKMLALWAAEHLGKDLSEAESYAEALVDRFIGAQEAALCETLLEDFSAANLPLRSEDVQFHMTRMLSEAKAQLLTEG